MKLGHINQSVSSVICTVYLGLTIVVRVVAIGYIAGHYCLLSYFKDFLGAGEISLDEYISRSTIVYNGHMLHNF